MISITLKVNFGDFIQSRLFFCFHFGFLLLLLLLSKSYIAICRKVRLRSFHMLNEGFNKDKYKLKFNVIFH